MRLAADRDSVARQYANGFADVFDLVAPELQRGVERGWSTADVIVRTHLHVLHHLPDTLITRKCGLAKAQEVAAWAGQVLDAGLPGDEAYHEALADLDFELRSDGHRAHRCRAHGRPADGRVYAARARGIRHGRCRLRPHG